MKNRLKSVCDSKWKDRKGEKGRRTLKNISFFSQGAALTDHKMKKFQQKFVDTFLE